MKDFFGQELQIGDEVAFLPDHYRELKLGKIAYFTPKQVRIEFPNRYTPATVDTTVRYPNTIVKRIK